MKQEVLFQSKFAFMEELLYYIYVYIYIYIRVFAYNCTYVRKTHEAGGTFPK